MVTDGPDAPWSELSSALGALLAGSVLAMVLVNGGPIAMKILAGEGQDELVAQFFTAVIIARIPLFLFQAIQAALLPKLSALASAGGSTSSKRLPQARRVVASVGAVAVAAAFVVGPWAIRLLYGADFNLGHRTVGLLAAGSVLFMLAQAMAQAVIVLGGHTKMALCWLAPVTMFVVVTAAGQRPLPPRASSGCSPAARSPAPAWDSSCANSCATARRSTPATSSKPSTTSTSSRISLGCERSLRSLSPPSAGWSLAGPTPAS